LDSVEGGLTEMRRGSVDLEPLREWLAAWQACVRAGDFEGGRRLCASEMLAFGTRAEIADGLDAVVEHQWRHVWPVIRDFTVQVDEARGAVTGDSAWVAAPWHSLGTRQDGTTFRRPGRLTIAFQRRAGRWLAVHTHFSLSPAPDRG
jgi:ketosteroid isomerase-like protein